MEQFQARLLASNTVRGYASDWKDFVAWCGAQGRKSLPAEVDTAYLYVVDCAQRLTKATLNRRIAVISRKHRDAGDTSPTEGGKFRQVRAGVRRRRAEPQVAKRPLRAADLFEILA
jgi:site-specific recombinase XerD